MLAAQKYGMGDLPKKALLELGWVMLHYHLKYEEGVELYGKYVGGWGGDSTTWKFEAVKNGKVVKTVLKTPNTKLHLDVRTSSVELQEGDVYDMSFVLFALMTGVSVLCYAPVNRLAVKYGKKKLVTTAFVLFSIVFLVTAFCGTLGISGMVWGLIIGISAAIPMAVLGILPQAIVADIAEADAKITGENRQGMFYAARTFAFKMGQSVAMLLFTSLALIGTNGLGYRISAGAAAVLCLLGGIVLFAYDEKKIMNIISK